MSIETIWEDFTSSEKHLFQKSCRRLLKQTFLVRDKDEDYKKMYYFVAKRQEVFEQYFSFIGFDIVLDRENGVVMLRNSAEFGENGKLQGNRLALKKAESLVLCCLWTLYVDRLRSGSLAQTITVSITDLGKIRTQGTVRQNIDGKYPEIIFPLQSDRSERKGRGAGLPHPPVCIFAVCFGYRGI